MDNGKVIHWTEDFHKLMATVGEKLNLKTVTLKNGEGKEFEVSGSTDWKGIKGTDKRKYILDLIRATPRDANFPDEEHAAWVVRRELMMIYQKTKSLEYARE